MKKRLILAVGLLLSVSRVWAEDKKVDPISTPNYSRELEVERLKLDLERLKLENQRLQLQIRSLQMGITETTEGDKKEEAGSGGKDEKKDEKKNAKVATEIMIKAEALAKQRAEDDKAVVLDFTNGEIWYRGVRYGMNQFNHLCEDAKWSVKGELVKLSVNGDSLYRYRHQNLSMEKYQNYPKGVFVYSAKQTPEDLGFVSAEGIDEESTRGAIRNGFETPYLKYDSERKEDQWQVIRYKHSNGLLAFDDLLEFWMGKTGKIEKVKWGVLDKK